MVKSVKRNKKGGGWFKPSDSKIVEKMITDYHHIDKDMEQLKNKWISSKFEEKYSKYEKLEIHPEIHDYIKQLRAEDNLSNPFLEDMKSITRPKQTAGGKRRTRSKKGKKSGTKKTRKTRKTRKR
jgi:hypothetical protein